MATPRSLPRGADMGEVKTRPGSYKHLTYKGKLGEVVGIADVRGKNGGTIYRVKCADCGEIHHRNTKEIQLGYRSRECKLFRNHTYRGLNRWDGIIRRTYGITLVQYHEKLSAQGGGCAICGTKVDQVKTRRLAIDHCHATGKVRGVLCTKCNQGVGHFNDSLDLLDKAKAYLIQYSTAV